MLAKDQRLVFLFFLMHRFHVKQEQSNVVSFS